jgi:hypothetical protein
MKSTNYGHLMPFCARILLSGKTILAALTLTSFLISSIANAGFIEGYLSEFSTTLGSSIDLYASTDAETYDAVIYKKGVYDTVVASYTDLPGLLQAVPAEMPWEIGAGAWEKSITIDIPDTWESGYYYVRLFDGSDAYEIHFPVRENNPASVSGMLVIDAAPTSVAYNGWGGKCSYNHCSEDGRASITSLKRPGNHKILAREKQFVDWLDYMNIDAEFASGMDLQTDPTLLNPYSTLVIVGHSEYWSRTMRDRLDEFVEAGGNAIILSGNTMWWQVRFENDNLVVYKNKGLDPMTGINDDVVTVRWWDDPVFYPENSSIGVSFRNGGSVNTPNSLFREADGYGGFWIADSQHNFMSGTGLTNKEILGFEHHIAGHETDGALFEWVDNKPVVTGTDGTPLDFQVLAYSPANFLPAHTNPEPGATTMGVFTNGGTVFNAAVVRWSDGLWVTKDREIADPRVSKITLNVIAEFEPTSAAACHAGQPVANDADSDGIADVCDNCVIHTNPFQEDANNDGTGDACDITQVALDFLPGSTDNYVDLEVKRALQLGVLTESVASGDATDFDPTQIDPASVQFGPDGASLNFAFPNGDQRDVDDDGDLDMRFIFTTAETGIACEATLHDTYVEFEAELYSGEQVAGWDHLKTAECEVDSGCHP